MPTMIKVTTSMIFLMCCVSAHAATKLTPEECHDYPFVRPAGELTHAQVMRELTELEAVGYDPSRNDLYYPTELQAAEQKVHEEYLRDCAPPMQR